MDIGYEMRRVAVAFAFVVAAGIGAASAQTPNAPNVPNGPSTPGTPKIWFGMGAISSDAGHHSWETLYYQRDPQWPPALTRVTVMGLLTQALVKIPDADLARVVAELKRRHIALGVEMLAQAYTLPGMTAPAGCGGGVEGYYPPEQTAALAARIRRAGGQLDYIAMDEPLWFGHYYTGPHACRSSIEDVAARVAANLREYQKLFPNVVIGDIEPFPSITDEPQWSADYQHWREAFRRAVGEPVAFPVGGPQTGGRRPGPRSLVAAAAFRPSCRSPFRGDLQRCSVNGGHDQSGLARCSGAQRCLYRTRSARVTGLDYLHFLGPLSGACRDGPVRARRGLCAHTVSEAA